MSGYLSVIVAIVGLFLYVYFSRTPPTEPTERKTLAEIGRIAFAFGLFAILLANGNAMLSLIAIQGALSALVCIFGLVVFLLARNSATVQEIGRICYAMGLLAFLIASGGQVISVLNSK